MDLFLDVCSEKPSPTARVHPPRRDRSLNLKDMVNQTGNYFSPRRNRSINQKDRLTNSCARRTDVRLATRLPCVA